MNTNEYNDCDILINSQLDNECERKKLIKKGFCIISLKEFLQLPEIIKYRDRMILERYHWDYTLKRACFIEKNYDNFRNEYEDAFNEKLTHLMIDNKTTEALNNLQNFYSCADDKDINDMYWDEYYDMRFGMRLICSLEGSNKDKKICDLACGHGEQLIHINLNNNVTGLDLSSIRVEECKAKGINAYQGSADNTKFKNNSFDVVIAEELLEHVKDPVAVVREAWRILKPYGKFYITTPLGNNCNSSTHVRFFSINILYTILKMENFEIENIIMIPYVNTDLYDNNIMACAVKSIS